MNQDSIECGHTAEDITYVQVFRSNIKVLIPALIAFLCVVVTAWYSFAQVPQDVASDELKRRRDELKSVLILITYAIPVLVEAIMGYRHREAIQSMRLVMLAYSISLRIGIIMLVSGAMIEALMTDRTVSITVIELSFHIVSSSGLAGILFHTVTRARTISWELEKPTVGQLGQIGATIITIILTMVSIIYRDKVETDPKKTNSEEFNFDELLSDFNFSELLNDSGEFIIENGIEFGDDSSFFKGDGECDDPRFQNIDKEDGMAPEPLFLKNRYRDGTDCLTLFQSGKIELIE